MVITRLGNIHRLIYMFRGHKVMLDQDLAVLYGVSTKVLNQAVKRNIKRFPTDFMFQLLKEEALHLRTQAGFSRSQIVTLNGGRGSNIKYLPYVFTEQGVAMLSSVLNSERAIRVNIAIMRAFVRLRDMVASNKDLAQRLDSLEKKYDANFRVVFDAIRDLMGSPVESKPRIGFRR